MIVLKSLDTLYKKPLGQPFTTIFAIFNKFTFQLGYCFISAVHLSACLFASAVPESSLKLKVKEYPITFLIVPAIYKKIEQYSVINTTFKAKISVKP